MALKLYGRVARILGRWDLADAVFEDVHVRVWHRAGDFDARGGAPIAWRATMARDVALEAARRKAAGSLADIAQVFERPCEDEASANQECNEERDGSSQVATDWRRKSECAMTRGEQISSRVDWPVARVKTWLRGSLAELKECLGQ